MDSHVDVHTAQPTPSVGFCNVASAKATWQDLIQMLAGQSSDFVNDRLGYRFRDTSTPGVAPSLARFDQFVYISVRGSFLSPVRAVQTFAVAPDSEILLELLCTLPCQA